MPVRPAPRLFHRPISGCLIVAWLIALLVLIPAVSRAERPALTAGQAKRLKSREPFEEEARKLRKQGKIAEAIPAIEKMLAIEHEVLGVNHEEVANSYRWLAEAHEARNAFTDATKDFDEVVTIMTRLHGASNWRTTDARVERDRIKRYGMLSPDQRQRLKEADAQDLKAAALHQEKSDTTAVTLLEKCVEIRKQVLGSNDLEYANAQRALGGAYSWVRQYPRAAECYLEVVAIRRKVLGEVHPSHASALNTLALAYENQDQYSKAEALYRQAAAIDKEAIGPTDPNYLVILNNLQLVNERWAVHEENLRNFPAAIAARKNVLELVRERFGHNDWRATDAQQDLARTQKLEGLQPQGLRELDGTKQLAAKMKALFKKREFRKSLGPAGQIADIKRRLLGEKSSDHASALLDLGTLNRLAGEYPKAESLLLQAVELNRELFGEEHPEYAQGLLQLALTAQAEGDADRAATLLTKSAAILKRVFGGSHQRYRDVVDLLITLYSDVAQVAFNKQDFVAAQEAYRKTEAAQSEAYGPQNWRTIDTRLSMAYLKALSALDLPQRQKLDETEKLRLKVQKLIQEHKYTEALQPAQEVSKNFQEILGTKGLRYVVSVGVLGLVYQGLNREKQSEEAYRQALALDRDLFGEQHPAYASMLENLALHYRARQQFPTALGFARPAWLIRLKAVGGDDDATRQSQSLLVDCLERSAQQAEDRDDYAASKKARQEILECSTSMFGAKSWRTIDARCRLAECDTIAGLTPDQRRRVASTAQLMRKSYELEKDKKYREACAAVEEAKQIRKELLHDDSQLYAATVLRLGSLYSGLTEYTKSEASTLEAIALYKKTLGESHPEHAVSLNNLGVLYLRKHEYANSRPPLARAAAIFRAALGERDTEYLNTLTNLEGVLTKLALEQEKQPNFAAAAQTRQDLLAIKIERFGEKQPEIAELRRTMNHDRMLGKLDGDQRRQLSETEESLKKARQLQSQGEYQKAQELAERVLEIRQRFLGEDDPETAEAWDCCCTLAATTVALKPISPKSKLSDQQRRRLAQRDQLFARAKELRWKDELAGALDAGRQMLAIELEVRGPVHEEVALSLDFLAEIQTDRDQFRSAYDLRKSALAQRNKLSGEKSWQAAEERYHVNDVSRLSWLDANARRRLYRSQSAVRQLQQRGEASRLQAVIDLQKQAKEDVEAVLGKENHHYVSCLIGLSRLYNTDNDPENEISSCVEAATISGKIFGKKHPAYRSLLEQAINICCQSAESNAYLAIFPTASRSPRVSSIEPREIALKYYGRQAELTTLLKGEKDWRTTDVRLAVAQLKRDTLLDEKQRAKLKLLRQEESEGRYELRNTPLPEKRTTAQRLVQTCKELFGEETAEYARNLHQLGMALYGLGDYEQALKPLQQAAEIRKRELGEDHPDYVESLNGLAHVFYARGEFAEAEPRWQQAREILERIDFKANLAYADILNNLGLLYEALGDFDRAETMLRQVLEVCDMATDPDSPDPSTGRRALPRRYETLLAEFDISGAYRDSNVRAQAPERKPALPAPAYLNNLALLVNARGDHRRAEELMRQVLGAIRLEAVRQKLAPAMLEVEDNIASTESEAMEQASYATAVGNLAVLYQSQGDFAKAEPLLHFAARARKRQFGESHVKYGLTLNNLGEHYFLRGDRERAQRYWEEALAVRAKALGEGHPQSLVSQANIALLETIAGENAQAAFRLHKVLKHAYSTLEATAAVQSERQQLILLQSVRNFLNQYLSLIVPGEGDAEQAYAEVLSWKGTVFARQRRIREQRSVARSAPDTELAALFQQLEETSRAIGRLVLKGTDQSPEDSRRARLDESVATGSIEELTRKKEKIEAELSRRSPAYQARQEIKHITPRKLCDSLPKDAVLVDFLVYRRLIVSGDEKKQPRREPYVVAFVVKPNGSIAALDLGRQEPIAQAIERWRTTTVKRVRAEGPDDPGAVLKHLLWEPLEPHVKSARIVLISPDEVLARLPFAALPGSSPGKYLAEETSIAMIGVPQLLPELLRPPTPGKADEGILLVGDVDFGKETGPAAASPGIAMKTTGRKLPTFSPLPGTRRELEAVRASYQASHAGLSIHALRGAEATESAFRQQATACRYLHVATHGFFLPAMPSHVDDAQTLFEADDEFQDSLLMPVHAAPLDPGLSCGIVLAGANQTPLSGQDDGVLTALEMADLDLSGVELAVLSACQTGLGKLEGGEGVLGLQRALQVSGARTVVATLWQIPDEPTRLLMERFYQNLWEKKLSKLNALCEAQLWMLRDGTRHAGLNRGLDLDQRDAPKDPGGRLPPFYWAAFVLSGDWR